MQLGTMEHIVRSVKRLMRSHSFHTFGMERRNPNPRVKSEGKVWAAQFTSTEIINNSVIKQATTDIIALIIYYTNIQSNRNYERITERCGVGHNRVHYRVVSLPNSLHSLT